MKFKNWINSLTHQKLMALACQHGMNGWLRASRKELCAFLVKNKRAREMYREMYGP